METSLGKQTARNFTMILLISVIAGIISIGAGFCTAKILSVKSIKEVSNIEKDIKRSVDSDDIDDVEGHGIIIKSLALGTAHLGAFLIKLALIIVPYIEFMGSLILLGIARLIQIGKNESWKLITGKVFVIISIVLKIGLIFFLSSLVISFGAIIFKYPFNKILIVITIMLLQIILYTGQIIQAIGLIFKDKNIASNLLKRMNF